MAFDTIIKGGRVVDGSGLPMRTADVGVRDGMITDIGNLSGAKQVAPRAVAPPPNAVADKEPRARMVPSLKTIKLR